MITLQNFVKLLHAWVEANAQQESRLLYPDPGWRVDAEALLDYVYETSGLPKPEPR